MPTPVGHLLAGAIIYKSQKRISSLLFLFILFFALLPDVDFLFGFVVGDPNRYHHLFTHSFVFVIIAGLVGGIIYARWRDENVVFSSAIFISAGTTHVILDCLAVDKREPFGCPLGWPFSHEFVISPFSLFSDVSRISESHLFFRSLFNLHNLQTISVEIAILAPILLIAWLINSKSVVCTKALPSKK